MNKQTEHDPHKLALHRLKIREHNLLMRIAGESDPVAKADLKHALKAVTQSKAELMHSMELEG